MAKKLPAFQFYPGDWLKDPELSMCNPATRGIWIDLLCAMHESDRSGVIVGTPDQISRLCRCSAVELTMAIDEIRDTKTADITERDEKITIINRRMQRQHKELVGNRVRQKKHRKKASGNSEDNEKVTSYSSVSSSSSPSKQLSQEVPSEALVKAAIPILGLTCDVTLMDWLSMWPEGWIIKVLGKVATRGFPEARAAAWCVKVLQDWRQNGKPDDERQGAKPKAAKPVSTKFAGRD